MGIKLLCGKQYRSVRNRPIVILNTLGGPGGPVSLNIKPRRIRYEQESTIFFSKMAITFRALYNSTHLTQPRLGPVLEFSPHTGRIVELYNALDMNI